MRTRRSFIAATLALGFAGTATRAATPEVSLHATPEASPQGTPGSERWQVTGEGTLQAGIGEPKFAIDLTVENDKFEGQFSLTVFPVEGTEWLVESTEFVSIRPVSDMSPHITRVTGYCTTDGAHEAPFVLDLSKAREADESDELSFVSGDAAAPLLGEEMKEGCDCGPVGVSMRGPFIDGGFEVERD